MILYAMEARPPMMLYWIYMILLCNGDVLLHCVVDSILGASGLPDIGQIFSDSDPKWKGAASSVFMEEALSLCLPSEPVHLLFPQGLESSWKDTCLHYLVETLASGFLQHPQVEPSSRASLIDELRKVLS
ncbi:2-C-methyl-D-erythritol 2,4-cyclodiphosphate synthase, chloroplastic-like [Euphorbia lathyris]|uniref:2-C-methyl-D-erythritol 2,4-cyclodiphosphate synthase, chloroplastic-like n=1 Tax=Euphorbia lathyris TaxID=212925 RepID=UPI003313B319